MDTDAEWARLILGYIGKYTRERNWRMVELNFRVLGKHLETGGSLPTFPSSAEGEKT